MIRRLLLLLLLLFVVELVILVWIIRQTGPLFAVVLVLVMGIAGTALARYQGLRVWGRVQQQIQRGEAPTDPLLDALMIFVAGILLVFPGVLTDVVGLALLVPPLRRLVRNHVRARIHARFQRFSSDSAWRRAGEAEFDRDRIIDVRVVQSKPPKLGEEREEEPED